MRRTQYFLLATWLFLSLLSCSFKGEKMADLILKNGSIWTANPQQPWAEAVAVEGDKILKVGTTKDINQLKGPATRIVDLKGALVLPGFIDSHTHFLEAGFALMSIPLREACSREEFISRIGKKAKELGKGEWILSGNWDHQQFSRPELPRKEWIDRVTPDNPVCVNRLDGHMILANSLALKIADVTKKTPSPDGGEIQRDPETDELTGILKDAAMELVTRHIPEPTFQQKLKAAEAALCQAAECGVTSIHEMADASHFDVYQEIAKSGKLTTRIFLYIPVSQVDIYSRLNLKTPFGNDFLKIGGLKGFVDGSLGSSTALFFEPYSDDPRTSGLLHSQMFPEGIMEKRVDEADRAGLQVAIHAIGDKANALILDIFERVAAKNGPRDRRWRIEHAQHIRPEDIVRMGKLGVIVSVQPYHAADDGRWAESKIGKERARYTYPFASLLKNGVRLACGSDWSVAPLNPLTGIWAAVTRQTRDGKNPGGWIPEEKISLEDAIRGYTLNAAFAEFSENSKGSIEAGKLADLVVLSENIFHLPPERIKDVQVKMTIVGGKKISEASGIS